MRVLIAGCGYVGVPLGAELVKQGHEVFGVRRTGAANSELRAAGIIPLNADVTKLPELQRFPCTFDWVVNTVSSSKGGVQDYREVYLQGMRNLMTSLEAAGPQKFIYTSSTSVYGQTDGSWVEENSATEPASETARVLLEAEQVLLEAARPGGESSKDREQFRLGAPDFPAVVLRVAGIYGPSRGYWFRQYLQGEAQMRGQGARILNMIHRDDLIHIIIAALKHGRPGEIYNAVDDEPVSQIDFFRWLSKTMVRPMPPFVAEAEGPTRKRGVTNKRVSNRKVKEALSYRFKYPTFREGFGAELKVLPGVR